MQAHPNHRDLPEGALEDAMEALVWCHAGEVSKYEINTTRNQATARSGLIQDI